jgi:hypothetical protein
MSVVGFHVEQRPAEPQDVSRETAAGAGGAAAL